MVPEDGVEGTEEIEEADLITRGAVEMGGRKRLQHADTKQVKI